VSNQENKSVKGKKEEERERSGGEELNKNGKETMNSVDT